MNILNQNTSTGVTLSIIEKQLQALLWILAESPPPLIAQPIKSR